jgi:3'-phosphoadenosine 5'-phosphosulfate (PAPS) 3'-phosphatase
MTQRLSPDLAIAIDAAAAAGAVALRMQGAVAERTKEDGSPVSDADLAADAAVREVLSRRCPDDAILSEEVADSPARLAHRRVWIIDPIDGTRDYLEGRTEWAVQVALAVDGVLTASALAIPHDGAVVAGGPADGCWLQDAGGMRRFAMAPTAGQVLITSKSSRNREQVAKVRAALPEFAWVPTTSVGVKVWRMLQGAADLFVHARQIHEWDAAAPAGVLAAAGGTATDLVGGDLRYNTASSWCPGLVFSRRADHAAIVARLQAADVGLAG